MVVIIMSMLIGLIHIYPDLKFIYGSGKNFKGITFNATHDAGIYLGRINSIYNGGLKTIPAIDIYEHRHDSWSLPFLGEFILGTIGSSLKIQLNYFKIIFSFFLPIINFWLIYYLAFLLCNSKYAGLITACACTLGYSFFANNPAYIYKLLFERESAIQLWFLRPVSPQFNYVLLILCWIFIYLFMLEKKIIYSLLSGLSIGLFFYIGGVYYFTYFFIFTGIYFCYSLIKKDYAQLKMISVIMLLTIILAIPFARNYYNLTHLPEYKFLLERLSFIYGRKPIIPIGITVLSFFLSWFHYSRNTRQANFISFFIFAGFICLNQQLITGRTSQPSHWQNYMVKTFAIIAFFPTLALCVKNNKHIRASRKLLTGIAVSSFIILAILQQDNYYQRFKIKFIRMQNLAGPFKWLKENTKREDVVLNDAMNFMAGNMPFQQDFLMYTNNFVYLPAAINTLVSRDENEYRYLSALRFFNYSLDDAESFFTYWNGIFFRGMVAESSFGGTKISDSYLHHLKNKYTDFLKENPLHLIAKYKIDYIILDKSNLLYGKIEYIYKQLIKVYDDGQFKIYKMPINENKNV